MRNGRFTLAAVGDCSTGLEPPEALFAHVMTPLKSADLRFAQCERLYSERGSFQQQGMAPHVRQHPRMAEAFKAVPFDVVGIGSNRTGDWGPEAAADTIETIQKLGLKAIGAGRTIEEARTPAIVEANGFRIAFLGYVSVMLPQYWATETRAGSTPMRAHTYYEPYEYQPGAPPRIVTIPHKRDLELLVDDVRRAKQLADFVVLSMHWGVHFIAKPLADYQVTVAHAAIDAGAALILGHHPHVMQAVELYEGAVIFYSLGNFAFFRRGGSPNYLCPQGEYEFADAYSRDVDPGHTFHYNRHRIEGRIAYVDFDGAGVTRVSLLPTLMNENCQPLVVGPQAPEFSEALRFASWVSDSIEGGLKDVCVADDRLLLYER